jgi:hypothetical protein
MESDEFSLERLACRLRDDLGAVGVRVRSYRSHRSRSGVVHCLELKHRDGGRLGTIKHSQDGRQIQVSNVRAPFALAAVPASEAVAASRIVEQTRELARQRLEKFDHPDALWRRRRNNRAIMGVTLVAILWHALLILIGFFWAGRSATDRSRRTTS